MDWRDIPSLSALRAFEAAARLRSLSGAAKALNVTHAAISQHVRTLEADLGTDLLVRAGRGVALTDTGRQLAQALQDGFGQISEGIKAVRAEQLQRPLVISLTPAFAENWLMPRLGQFWAKHPDIALALRPSIGLVDLKRDAVDLAIRFGRGQYDGVKSEELTTSALAIIATPDLLERNRGKPLARMPWFLSRSYPEALHWAQSAGHIDAATPITEFDTDTLVLSALRAGHGVSAQNLTLLETDLAAGRLVELDRQHDKTFGYHLVTRDQPPSPALHSFLKWIRTAS